MSIERRSALDDGRLDQETADWVSDIAREEGVSMAEVIRKILGQTRRREMRAMRNARYAADGGEGDCRRPSADGKVTYYCWCV